MANIRIGDVYVGKGHRFPTFEVDSFFKSRYATSTPKVLVRYTAKEAGGRMEVLDTEFVKTRCTLVRRGPGK
jgi:hypothetical protein